MMVNRQQLAKFLPDNESIRIFEDLVRTADGAYASAGVIQGLPSQISTTGLADSGLQIAVAANSAYWFSFVASYSATAGTRFTLDGPAGVVDYKSEWALTDTTSTVINASAYGLPAGVNASVIGGMVRIEGIVTPTVDGTVKLQFQSSATVTIKAGYSRSIRLT